MIEYIAELDGKATINKVAIYMRDGVDDKYTLAKETVRGVIERFEESGRITVQRDKPGRPHYLRVVSESWYDRISEQIENINLFYKEHPDFPDRAINLLLMNLARVHKHIKNESDRHIMNEKIINSLLRIRYKKEDEDLISKV